jgi:hypothetical protein
MIIHNSILSEMSYFFIFHFFQTIGLLKSALDKGRSVVVDNTHVDIEARWKTFPMLYH